MSACERCLARTWLLDRLESPDYWPDPDHPELMTVAQLADRAGSDRGFLQVAALYRGKVQAVFNGWAQATALPLSHLSMTLAASRD